MRINSKLYRVLLGLFIGLLSIKSHAALNVFACEPEWKALIEILGKERVDVVSATNAFQDPHYIEARPSLIVKLRRADFLICTGADLEIGWLPLLLKKSGNQKVLPSQLGHFMASDFVKRLEVPHRHDRSDGDVHAAGNPHVHLDPQRLLLIATELKNRLTQVEPEHERFYEDNYQAFKTRWLSNMDRWKQKTKPLMSKEFIVYHRNWSYLFDWLSLKELADLEPKPGVPPNSRYLTALLSKTDSTQAKGILVSNYQNPKAAHWLSERTALPVITLPFTVGANDDVQTLEGLFDAIIDQLLTNGEK